VKQGKGGALAPLTAGEVAAEGGDCQGTKKKKRRNSARENCLVSEGKSRANPIKKKKKNQRGRNRKGETQEMGRVWKEGFQAMRGGGGGTLRRGKGGFPNSLKRLPTPRRYYIRKKKERAVRDAQCVVAKSWE